MNELDKWIYGCLNRAVKTVRESLESYRYNDAASAIMEYFWNEFCDWYVEATKINFKNPQNVWQMLYVLWIFCHCLHMEGMERSDIIHEWRGLTPSVVLSAKIYKMYCVFLH